MARRTLGLLVVLGLVVSVGLACSEPKPAPPPPQGAGAEGDWWDNPGQYTDALYAVGSAPMKSPMAAQNARDSAYTNGQRQIAAALEVKIQSLVSTWSKSTGDAADEATIQELFNNEQFTRAIVNTVLKGARAVKYHTPKEPGVVYCLVALDAQKYTSAVKQSASDQLKKVRTEVMTQIRKDECERKLDELLDKEEKKIHEQEEALIQSRGLPKKVS